MVYNDDYFYITVNNIKETLLICKNNNDFFENQTSAVFHGTYTRL